MLRIVHFLFKINKKKVYHIIIVVVGRAKKYSIFI